jgi:UDP-glucose 4-epimerase
MLQHLHDRPITPRRVVVVGAGGFVGGAVAARLEADGTAVLRVTRHDVELLQAGAAERLGARLQPDDVLVAAVAMAPCKNAAMLRDNILIADALIGAAAGKNLSHVVNISSDAVYADASVPLTEQSVMAPDTLHGVMHLARETMLRSEIAAPLAMLRPTLIYGASDPHNGYGPNRFRRLAERGEPIVLFGKGEERRDHVHIDDVAEIVARVVYRRSRGALNVATGAATSFAEIAAAVARLAGHPVPIRETARSGPMPHNGYRAFDIAACRAAFPDFAYVSLSDGLARAQQQARGAAKGGEPRR